jgi:hypothetical protein
MQCTVMQCDLMIDAQQGCRQIDAVAMTDLAVIPPCQQTVLSLDGSLPLLVAPLCGFNNAIHRTIAVLSLSSLFASLCKAASSLDRLIAASTNAMTLRAINKLMARLFAKTLVVDGACQDVDPRGDRHHVSPLRKCLLDPSRSSQGGYRSVDFVLSPTR